MAYAHDWPDIYSRLALMIENGEVENISDAASKLKVNRNTFDAHMRQEFGLSVDNFFDFPAILDEWERSKGLTFEGVFEEKDGNRWAISSKDRRITTLEDLIKICEIDLDVWEIERHVINKWEVGVGSGPDTNRTINEFPLFQVKAWLRKINPTPVIPVIHPITVETKYAKPKKSKAKIKQALFLFDIQFGFRKNLQTNELVPFHDRRALDVVLQIVDEIKPDRIVLGGDELDLSEWSTRWTAEPEFYFTTQPTLIEAFWWLSQLREAAPDAQIDMLDGNHNRFQDAIVSHLTAAYQLRPADELGRDAILTMPRMLALDKLNINYIDGYKNNSSRVWINDRVSATHSDVARAGLGATAGAMTNKNYYTTLFGHVHRREMASKTMTLRDEKIVVTSFCPGCLCHIDGRVPGSKEDSNWQQGAALVNYTDDGHHNLNPVEIEDGTAILGTSMYEARDRDDEANAVIRDGLNRIAGLQNK